MSLGVIQLVANIATCSLDRDRLFNCFFVARMRRRQLFNFENVHAEIADFAETQPGELRDCFAHSPENIFNRMKRIAATDCLKKVTYNFPVIARIARRASRSVQPL